MQDRHRGFRLLADVEEAEGVGAVGVDDRVQVDPADALERADHEGVGGEQLARPLALDMPLAKAGIELLQERRLLRAQLDRRSAFCRSSASQRSWRVPRPLSLRIFCTVIADTRRPSRASRASILLQP